MKVFLRRVVTVSRQASVHQLAKSAAKEVFVADDLSEASQITQTVNPDLVFFDHYFTAEQVREFLDTPDNKSIRIPVVIVFDGEDDKDLSLEEYRRAGIFDYLQSSSDYGRLKQIIALIKQEPGKTSRSDEPLPYFADDFAGSASIVGRSEAVTEQLKMIKLVAQSGCDPVLILGETGTGKELAARAVHNLRSPKKRFVALNCAALTASLLESELFGHMKGSFTGADREKVGLLEMAGSGSVFLDEISEMPTGLQAKLLRVLQEREFRKVGGVETIHCKATIIASSNKDLYKEVEAKRFRRDLYYRLNVCPIKIEPLRSPRRREDIRILAEYFLRTSSLCPEKRDKITGITQLAIEALERHDWPGNVRELYNVIQRAILLETADKIGLSSIMIDSADSDREHIRDFSLAKAERGLIARALQETGWQKTQAATLLGISRATLYAKVEQYNIKKASDRQKDAQSSFSREDLPEAATVS